MSASLSQGVLRIEGTDGDDSIRVQVAPSPGRRGLGIVRVEGIGRSFPAGRIKAIVVAGHGGNDRIELLDRPRRSIRGWLDGGEGDDTLIGGSKPDTLIGGPGSDVLFGGGGRNHYDGGDGLDTIEGVAEIAPQDPVSPTPDPTPATPVNPPIVGNPDPLAQLDSITRRMFERTNEERERAGLGALRLSTRLIGAANLHAGNMARLQQFAHVLPGTETPTLSDRIRKVGYAGTFAGENLAFNYQSADQALNAWMASTGHRENILLPDYTEIGVALAYDSLGQPYYVQVFGRPLG